MLLAGVTVALLGEGAPSTARAGARAEQTHAAKGIELSDLDRTVDPCTDFYGFANGAWRKANPIPAGVGRWSRRAAAKEANRQQLITLLEGLAAKSDWPRGSIRQQLGDHFAACMNEPAIDAAGVKPLAPLLGAIDRIQDVGDVQQMIFTLDDLAIPAPLSISAGSDYHDPERVILNIAAGGLGLPDRDAYLSVEPRFVQARELYRSHVTRMLTLAGEAGAAGARAADEILSLETRLAQASLPKAVAEDPAATAHKTSVAELSRPGTLFSWKAYFATNRLPLIDVNVAEPEFVAGLNRELATTPVTTWKAYLTWRLIESSAPWLSKPLAAESFAFKEKSLGGGLPMKSRAMTCLESTEALFGEPLGRMYSEQYFPAAAKARLKDMVKNLLAVLKEDVRALAWMSSAARQEAIAKLDQYEVLVGYPDQWIDQKALVIRRDAFWENVAAARRFGVETSRKHIGRRDNRSVWRLPASSPDAYIDVQQNVMGLPSGFLQPPAFDLTASDAVNYGAIGISIAHDMAHAIDELGRDFDASGQPRLWWTKSDRDAFQKMGQCTMDQYESYAIESGERHQGKLVLGEALGDLAGVRIAYRALHRATRTRLEATTDEFSEDQQFFISWGQFRGAAESPELQRQMLKTDPHPVARYRVIGPLANTVEFERAFACPAGSAMVRPPERRCAAW